MLKGLVILSALFFSSGIHTSVQAQPIVPAADGTGTSVKLIENQFEITGGQFSQDGQNLFHSFERFGLEPGQIANFFSSPSIRNILGRVSGGEASIIDGILRVSGGNSSLFLMNPSGIIFGASAQLEIPGGLTATTANGISFGRLWLSAFGSNTYQDLMGSPTGFAWTMSNPGTIINAGDLSVGANQSLTLLAGSVINTGKLSAPSGSVTTASVAGNSWLRLKQSGSFLSFDIQPSVLENQPQAWNLPISSLPSLLAQHPGRNSTGLAMNAQGEVTLTGSGVVLSQQPGTTVVTGKINATGETGGMIQVLGRSIELSQAELDASGQTAGGTIQIGGAVRGNGQVPNANQLTVDRATTIRADSRDRGNGGSVSLWASDRTDFLGNISVRGGSNSGDGGFAEVSGRRYLTFDGNVDTGSRVGNSGTLLIDPDDILISDNLSDASPGQSFLSTNTLYSLDSNLIIEANNNIQIANGVSLTFPRDGRDIVFRADADQNGIGDFIMDTNTTISAASPVGSTSGRTLTISGANLRLGNINTRSGVDLATQQPVPGGNVVLSAKKDITVGFITSFADSNLPSTANPGNAGKIEITSQEGGITVNGILWAEAAQGRGNDITLEAQGDIMARTISTGTVTSESAGTGQIKIISRAGSVNVGNPVTQDGANPFPGQQQPSGVNFSTFGKNAGSLLIDAAKDVVLNRNINGRASNTSGSVSITSRSGTINATNTILDVSSDTGAAGNVVLNAPNGQLLLSDIKTNSQSQAGNISLAGSQGILIKGNIATQGATSSGNLDFRSPVILTGDLAIDAGSSGTINFDSSINAPYNLSVVGNTLRLGGDVSVRQLVANASNTIVNGNLTTDNQSIIFDQAVTLSNRSVFNAGTAAISVNAPLNANNHPLTLQADSVNLNGVITGTNTLNLQPTSLNRAIELGTKNPNALSLTAAELAQISGFQGVKISSNGGKLSVLSPLAFNVPVEIDPGVGAIFLGANVSSSGQNLTFGRAILEADTRVNSNGGNITFTDTIESQANGQYSLATAAGNGNLRFGAAVGGTNRLRNFQVENANQIFLTGGINIASGDLAITQPITLTGGSTTLSTNAGNITLAQNVTSQPGLTSSLQILAPTGNITTASIDTSNTTGGSVFLSSPRGIVTTNNLITRGTTGGGDVRVIAFDSIKAGIIDTSTNTGNAGNVFLDPLNDIEVSSINTQALAGGIGGNVEIFTQRFFRATGSFIDQTGLPASISTVDGGSGGNILITHDGGARFVTFDVGANAGVGSGGINGAIAALRTSSGNTIEPTRFFPGSYRQGNIGIVTSPQFENLLARIVPEGRLPELLDGDPQEEGFGLDFYFTNQLEKYFNREQTRSATLTKSLDEIQNRLNEIERVTGVRPALIYAVFLDSKITSEQILYRFPQNIQPKENDVLNLVLVTGRAKPIVYQLPEFTRAQIGQVVTELNDDIASQSKRQDINFMEGDNALGKQFYRWLVKRLEPDLKAYQISNLTFILDTYLRSVPIAAMFDEKGQPLLRSYSFGLMPSFSITDTQYNPRFNRSKILAMGTDDFRRSSRPSMSPLPAVPLELEIVSRHLGTGRILQGRDFTVENLIERRNQAQVVHIGTHGSFIPSNSKESFILFDNQEWQLTRMSHFKLHHPTVELLVLSACETAIGDPSSELGFVGLSAEAGVRSSVGSLWQVSDYGTLSLMAEFYRQLEMAPIKAEALRRAQLALLDGSVRFQDGKLIYSGGSIPLQGRLPITEDRNFSAGYFWSAFTLIGSPW
ncbi:CHAT domain-containing protein [Leptolyngbya sp. GGD]|uniref:CHAT domain-containing protein n=1 Tax=Leptolyngbya sp. GGD TaxID=2997907 RepID=UPI00227B6FF0|nr:CHAT domain-containing protein [Leptolyngbya sp. GGD]MCY6494273.1 CHAT domain-containing protein [Leptolyngbya sp. GGD]